MTQVYTVWSVVALTAKAADTKDSFLCKCGLCLQFWTETFGTLHALKQPVDDQLEADGVLGECRKLVRFGDRVKVWGTHNGVVRYVGFLDDSYESQGVYVGVKLDDNIRSLENGIYNGKRYFHCTRGHGAMVPFMDVEVIPPAPRKPPISGNAMFPSWNEVKKKRENLKEMDPDLFMTRYGSPMTDNENKPRYTDRSSLTTTRAILNSSQSMSDSPFVEKRLKRWKTEFGSDDRAKSMVNTLRKLYSGYDRGLQALRGNLPTDESVVDEEEQ